MKALVTGGSGFLGGILLTRLVNDGWNCVNIDLQTCQVAHPNLLSVQGDIRNTDTLNGLFQNGHFDVIFHCAAILAHDCSDTTFLWTSNVDGTHNVAEAAKRFGVPNLVYTSTNCLWGENLGRPVREDDPPKPVEIYGQSKWEGEKLLADYSGHMNVVTIRCPTIMDAGRLGLLSILFEFIAEGRRVWVVGHGDNRYQFIYAADLVDAMLRGAGYASSDIFGIGADNVCSLRELYEFVIRHAGTSSRVSSLPKGPTILAMRAAHALRISPLGPYHYKMIAESFSFDTTKIKERLGWRPSLTNDQMLLRAYQYYSTNRREIEERKDVSSHRKNARMGVIRLLKWVS